MARDLPFSPTRIESRNEINLRREKPRVSFEHPVRDIDDYMDDIVHNAIDVIQEKARDNELRIFYFNMMSDKGYDNRDFEDLIGIIADLIDISVTEGKFRDVRDAVMPVVEDVILCHIGYMTDEHPELMDFVERRNERSIDNAVNTFQKYRDACDIYRRNGNRIPQGRRGSRDDRDDRRRDDRRDDRRVNYGGGRDRDRDRDDSPRRDKWNRSGVRDGVHGRTRSTARSNHFGGADQSDRFDDETPGDKRDNDRRNDREVERDERTSRREEAEDRYSNGTTPPAQTRRRATVQRLPGSTAESDIDDALARESEANNKEDNMSQTEFVAGVANPNNPVMQAYTHQDAWMPSAAHPHPLAFNHKSDLYYEMDLANSCVIPRIIDKKDIVDYWAHQSMSFNTVARDATRFDDEGVVNARSNVLHNSLLNATEPFTVEGSEETIVYHNRKDFSEDLKVGLSLKDAFMRLNFMRHAAEVQQINGESVHGIDIATAKTRLIEAYSVNTDEMVVLEELRGLTSFTKLYEKLRMVSKNVRTSVYVLLDQHITRAVVDMLRQNLSIPTLTIDSFSSDWLDLFTHISETYGEGYREAINRHQAGVLRELFNYDTTADEVVGKMLDPKQQVLKPFVMAPITKLACIDEMSFHLDLDMVPGVASQLMEESNPFFYDLAQHVLEPSNAYAHCFIQTADGRVVQASRSFLNEKAVLLRVIK